MALIIHAQPNMVIRLEGIGTIKVIKVPQSGVKLVMDMPEIKITTHKPQKVI